MSAAFSGAGAAVEPSEHANLTDGVDGELFWEGQEFNVTGVDAEEDVVIREVTDYDDNGDVSNTRVVRQRTTAASGSIVIDTSGLDGEYVITNDTVDETQAGVWEVTPQDLSAEWDEDSYDDSETAGELDIDSNRGSFNVSIRADGLDYDELEALFGDEDIVTNEAHLAEDPFDTDAETLSEHQDDDVITIETTGDATLNANFSNVSDIDAGDYSFELEATDTDASASAAVTVEEEDVEMSFSQGVYTEQEGDVAVITVQMEDASTGYMYVGGEDVNYLERVEFTDDDDDGQVTILMNTRYVGLNGTLTGLGSGAPEHASAVGDDAGFNVPEDSDDVIEDVTRYNSSDFASGEMDIDQTLGTSPLGQGDYALVVTGSGDAPEADDGDLEVPNEEDVATLDITARSTDSISTWVAPRGSATGLDDEELTELLEEDATESSDLAIGDRLIVQVEASGVYGYLSDEDISDLRNNDGLNLTIEQTNAGGNRDPKVIDLENSRAELYTMPTEDTFYVVLDTRSGVDVDRDEVGGTNVAAGLEDGDNWEASFTVGDEDQADSPNPYVDDEEEESVSTEFSTLDPDADFDNVVDGEVQVGQSAEASVTGTTNVAPGSELTVRFRRTGENPFLESETAVVQDDGTWEATFDTSQIPVDTTFDATVRYGGSAISDEEDGVIVQAQTPTETPTEQTPTEQTPTETEPPETETEPPETEPPETDTPTETDGQPGFGVAIAILALLGAALLALRRRD